MIRFDVKNGKPHVAITNMTLFQFGDISKEPFIHYTLEYSQAEASAEIRNCVFILNPKPTEVLKLLITSCKYHFNKRFRQ